MIKISRDQRPINSTEPSEDLTRCQEDVIKLSKLYQVKPKPLILET